MKRYALLLFLLFGISNTVFGYCTVDVTIDEITCGEPITGSTRIQCRGICTYAGVEKTYMGDTLYADVYLNCECISGCSEVTTQGTVFSEATCGRYRVVVRVWCNYAGCGCFPYCCYPKPILCGLAATHFTACCGNCDSCPCPCEPVCP